MRMRDRHERPRVDRPLRKLDAGLSLRSRRKIVRKPDGEDMPVLAVRVGRRMHLGAEDCGEAVGAKPARVDDRKAVAGEEMIGESDEVVPGIAIVSDHRLGRQPAVGAGGMGVQVAAKEASGVLEDVEAHRIIVWMLKPLPPCSRLPRRGHVRHSPHECVTKFPLAGQPQRNSRGGVVVR